MGGLPAGLPRSRPTCHDQAFRLPQLTVCVLAVIEHDGWILTAEGKQYGEDVPIIDITEEA